MNITRGIVEGAQKVVIYGPEGIGKSTFASKFPDPLFIDTEGSTKKLDVARTPKPTSWAMLMDQVRYVKVNPGICKTLIIDTADWAEQLCAEEILATAQKKGIEDFGYGKGYVYLGEEFGRLLNLLTDIVDRKINVVLTAHAKMRKFEQPDEMGAYDRWEMKLQKMTAPIVKEWADLLLFANYKTYVINIDDQGAAKGKNKAQGGARVLYTSHHSCWDAKNRHGLAPELKFEFSEIAHCIPSITAGTNAPEPQRESSAATHNEVAPEPTASTTQPAAARQVPPPVSGQIQDDSGIPQALLDLMRENQVLAPEIQIAVAKKGYYPQDTPIKNYSPDFINGVLIGAWAQVFKMVKDLREDSTIPF